MTSRRAFLSLTAAGLSGVAQTFSRPLGLQLYSLRREAAKDLPQTLRQVRELGFSDVEVGGSYGRTMAEFRRMLSDNGLKATSMGAGWDQLSKMTSHVAKDAHTLGVDYVTCSQIPRKKQLTLDDAVRAAESLNQWGESLATSRYVSAITSTATSSFPVRMEHCSTHSPNGWIANSLILKWMFFGSCLGMTIR